ncbi:MAG: glutamine--tRNA ligase [Bacteroidetes bacterium GWF2_43_63]|nr:MAG: glutamine--tRNA ligase [Bacteroidetes bacterium GWE2_42_42]OFY54122.1 MAG: glutamine--tRNA ligase [Bacteroidetes bacterium GWF2_43_63]HBG70844.1 glutamine--tRNA ligase [Bacteroidales bacterium]HCB61747.1 glutamine--tRNA ligase [Bacteroidales bacterium]HCY22123.1 glutamine--tRNA ligase [Bacteroidales bacterium]
MADEKINLPEEGKVQKNFIEEIIDSHLESGRFNYVLTRFPPEPNGYLHIGHAKSICLNFGLARKYNGKCNLRFDDTNPTREEVEYVDSIKEDVKWLGFEWANEFYASDYFQQLYDWAEKLIQGGKAYVCECSQETISANRTTPTRPGIACEHRDRTPEENMQLFRRMRDGAFPDGAMVLRAKIDLNSPNMHMRDAIMYRILHSEHHRTGNKWNIYPMYDYAHGQSDSMEGITHSVCTLEFEVHRPLYEWFIANIGIHAPQQIEFARLNLSYTVMSKRKLLQLVNEKYVNGWDDPRMPTISGMRRRGYTAESIRMFADKVGIAKRENVIELGLLEFCVREDLNKRAERRMAVLNPVKLIITNFDDANTDLLTAINNPEDEAAGTREIPFGRELYIEREDFMEEPVKGYHRLYQGNEVRLRYAYFVKCTGCKKDENGSVIEIYGEIDPASRGGNSPDGRKVKGTIHWVPAKQAVACETRLYDRLFTVHAPDDAEEGKTFVDYLNPDSIKTVTAYCEPALADAKPGQYFQFERLGYFVPDKESPEGKPVFNRTVTLKDGWAK